STAQVRYQSPDRMINVAASHARPAITAIVAHPRDLTDVSYGASSGVALDGRPRPWALQLVAERDRRLDLVGRQDLSPLGPDLVLEAVELAEGRPRAALSFRVERSAGHCRRLWPSLLPSPAAGVVAAARA